MSDFTLANGLKVIVAEDHSAPVAALGIWVRAGVCDEPDDRRGMAHFFEHLMFRGSENFAPKEHTERVARVGGHCNAWTSFDATVFHEVFPCHELDNMFALEADRFMRLKLDAEGVETEKKVVLEEVRVYENQPLTRAFRRLLASIGGQHPYGLDPLGHSEAVLACTVEDLQKFHRSLYCPDNAFVIVCGDVQVDEVKALAEKHFASWSNAADRQPTDVAPFRIPSGARAARVSLEVPLVARIHGLPPSAEVDHTALMLLWSLLADGEASPITETLVKQERLCVHAGASEYNLVHGGAMVFYGAFLPPGKHAARHAVIRRICDDLAARGPDHDVFEERLRRFKKRLANERYSVETQMRRFGDAELMRGDYRTYASTLEDLGTVTPERVQALAQTLFSTENTLELDITPESQKWWTPLAGVAMKVMPR